MKKKYELPDVLTAKNIQDYLNLSKTTVYSLFKESGFPTIRIGGSYRVYRDDFLNWIEQQKATKV